MLLTPWHGMAVQGIGPYIEVAFYHKKSRTLLVTDAVVSVPEKPPEVRTLPAFVILPPAAISASSDCFFW